MYINKKNIIDNRISSKTDKLLSAKQSKALQGQIKEIDEMVDVATANGVNLFEHIRKEILIWQKLKIS